MRQRIISLNKNVATFLHARKYASKAPATKGKVHCDAHMNELPIPCGPWEEYYSERQSFYNKWLAVGVIWWLFSLGMVVYTDSVFLNWSPPSHPAAPSNMADECEDEE
ncbi:unnamed protein product [Plutella xylostella]|uniref:(diamondback moth) hypothetical protein n=1 Tax=Plutella xylostella TaxID=51655 RepID=A0A8S4GAY7_PLUXY|nr:unnamed protein product [Plutella xylostella]